MTDIIPSANRIQQESVQFNQPVSESSISAIGALANYLRDAISPVGTIIHSMLTQAQLNAAVGSTPLTWVLADGSSAIGTVFATLTGRTTVPDLRGVFLRGKNNGRADGRQNPDGDLALGLFQVDQFGTHNHNFSDPGHQHGFNLPVQFRDSNYANGSNWSAYDKTGTSPEQFLATTPSVTHINFTASGGNETRARNVTVNIFIRVN